MCTVINRRIVKLCDKIGKVLINFLEICLGRALLEQIPARIYLLASVQPNPPVLWALGSNHRIKGTFQTSPQDRENRG